MYIIGTIKIAKKSPRININPFFRKGTPEKVVLVVDVGEEQVKILDAKECNFGIAESVDDKGRINVPKWIMEEFKYNKYEEFCLIIDDDGSAAFSPKTGSIL